MEKVDQIADMFLVLAETNPMSYRVISHSGNETLLSMRIKYSSVDILRKGDVFTIVKPKIGIPIKRTVMVDKLKNFFDRAVDKFLDELYVDLKLELEKQLKKDFVKLLDNE